MFKDSKPGMCTEVSSFYKRNNYTVCVCTASSIAILELEEVASLASPCHNRGEKTI